MGIVNEIKRNLRDVSKFHRDHIMERVKLRASLAERREPADLLDHYLDKMEEEKSMDKNDRKNIFPDVDPGNYLNFT